MSEALSQATERLLKLSFLPGIGTGALRRILSVAMSGGFEALGDEREVVHRYGRGSDDSRKQNPDGWVSLIDRCIAHEISILSPLDPTYPVALSKIDDYPPIIFHKGDATSLNIPGCAVVGTREASRLGLSWARQIAEILASHGFSVVSGLALGIDTAAHEGALRGNGRTVAILAHGLDKVTPASNKRLAELVLEHGGSLISEHPPGTPPRRAEYVRRNRIQSGMSVCSVVVESGEEGGAIHQGNFTTRQGRMLYTVCPDPNTLGSNEFNYGGAKRLIRDAKAKVLKDRTDLLSLIDNGTLLREFERLRSVISLL